MRNPFTEESFELVAIHAKDVMDDAVVNSCADCAKDWRGAISKFFLQGAILERSTLITDPLKKTNYLHSSLKARKSFQKTKP